MPAWMICARDVFLWTKIALNLVAHAEKNSSDSTCESGKLILKLI